MMTNIYCNMSKHFTGEWEEGDEWDNWRRKRMNGITGGGRG
jgi:hypothetical protein